ncbi:hypothetical protein JCM11641_002840 [Rhodosporidiobolus odoratus]
MNGHTHLKRTSPSRSPSPDDYSPIQFQASLDDGLAQAKQLVQGWIPTDLGAGWDTASSGASTAQGVQGLKDRMRAPRLGLGASASALHQQQAEDRKLVKQLGPNRTRAVGDEGANVKLANGDEGALENEEDSEDEEESRSKALGKGGKGKAKMSPINPFLLNGTSSAGKKLQAPIGVSSTAWSSTPSAPPSASTSSSTLISDPSAASTPSSAPSTAVSDPSNQPLLTKNQRKKLREQQKKEASKREREEASQREAEAEIEGGRAAKRVRTDDEGPPKEDRMDIEAGEVSPVPSVSTSITTTLVGSAPPSVTPSPTKISFDSQAEEGAGGVAAQSTAAGQGGEGKKKKKKKRRSKGGAQGAEGEEPLLKLGPMST